MIADQSLRSKVMGKKEVKRALVLRWRWLSNWARTKQRGSEVGEEHCHYGGHNKRFKPMTLQRQNNAN